MARTSTLLDAWGVIYQAEKTLPTELKIGFLETLAEEDGQIHLKDIIEGRKHDDVLPQIQAKKIRYQPKQPGSK